MYASASGTGEKMTENMKGKHDINFHDSLFMYNLL